MLGSKILSNVGSCTTYSGIHKALCATASQIACGLSILTTLGALSNLAGAIGAL